MENIQGGPGQEQRGWFEAIERFLPVEMKTSTRTVVLENVTDFRIRFQDRLIRFADRFGVYCEKEKIQK